MSFKRSREAFENDSAPYVIYGTALPQYDPESRDDGSYVPLWKQEVRDERGRKRLHGAFTGGFSAGYFNTVGSKEGWTPSTFVSSRTNRAAKQPVPQRAEDFMDEEDLAEAAEAEKLMTAENFAGLGLTEEDAGRKGKSIFTDSITSSGASMGVKLLQKMGWRLGQGLGPRVRRKARMDDEGRGQTKNGDEETHLFAPENSKVITYHKKSDTKGLGYSGEARRLDETSKEDENVEEDNEDRIFQSRKSKITLGKPSAKKSSFGVGVLNDTGSDDEDPYAIGPKISYNRTIGGSKKSKKAEKVKTSSTTANPLLRAKPVFLSKKIQDRTAGFHKCHDGRLPLKGFILATQPYVQGQTFPPPKVPDGWTSSREGGDQPSQPDPETYQSLRDVAKASTLDPRARAALLGEAALPGKSIFDYISPAARARLAAASGRGDLPLAKGEAPPPEHRKSEADKRKDLRDVIPELDRESAVGALRRGGSGWMPYADDEAKRGRYRAFLELSAGITETIPEKAAGVSRDDYLREMHEFLRAARVFKPMTGMMASKFTSSSRAFEGSNDSGDDSVLRKPEAKPSDPAEEAAKLGMFGPMTRSVQQFYPTRLLCKRFGVRPPDHAQQDQEAGQEGPMSDFVPNQPLDVVSKATMQEMMRESAANRTGGNAEQGVVDIPAPVVVNVERNEALEGDRPGDAVFRAIFGDDDDEDEE